MCYNTAVIAGVLKSFFKNLIYVFVAMGIIYLFLAIAIYSFVSGVLSAAGTMLTDIFALLNESVQSSGSAVEEFAAYAVGQIDWSRPFATVLAEIIDSRWLSNTLQGFLETLNVSVENFSESFGQIIGTFVSAVVVDFIVSILIICVGIYLASLFTGMLIRRSTARRSVKQFLISKIFQPVLSALSVLLLGYITAYIGQYSLLVVPAYVIVYTVAALFLSWLVYRDGSVSLKSVVNFKNTAASIGAAVLIIFIDIAAFVLVYLISKLIAILLFIPVIIYSFKIIGLSDDGYVKELSDAAKRASIENAPQQEPEMAEIAASETSPETGARN